MLRIPYVRFQMFTEAQCRDLIDRFEQSEGERWDFTDEAAIRTAWTQVQLSEDAAIVAKFDAALRDFSDLNYFTYEKLTVCEMLRYDKGDEIDWHVDYFHRGDAKVNLNVMLQHADEGGVFSLVNYGDMKLAIGECIVYPAFLAHRVTKVTKGTRYVMAGGGIGPAFR